MDASFQLNPGEKVGLVGPNGSGKTTLFRMVVGEKTADGGGGFCPQEDDERKPPERFPRARLRITSVVPALLPALRELGIVAIAPKTDCTGGSLCFSQRNHRVHLGSTRAGK